MDIQISQEQGRVPVTVIHVKGAVNGASYEQFQVRADESIAGGTRNLLIDLGEVPYMSSAGLRVLNALFDRLEDDPSTDRGKQRNTGISSGKWKSRHLKLLNPTPRVLQVLKMAGYDMFLGVHHSLEEAVASFGDSSPS